CPLNAPSNLIFTATRIIDQRTTLNYFTTASQRPIDFISRLSCSLSTIITLVLL
ncbi:unnamed protein product, partial [Callosobruchus maculatus]